MISTRYWQSPSAYLYLSYHGYNLPHLHFLNVSFVWFYGMPKIIVVILQNQWLNFQFIFITNKFTMFINISVVLQLPTRKENRINVSRDNFNRDFKRFGREQTFQLRRQQVPIKYRRKNRTIFLFTKC